MRALVVAALLAVAAVAHAAPTADAPVDDRADILAEADKTKLVEELNGLRRDGVQMAVIVVRSTEGTSIQQYARTAAEAWASGAAPAALLVVATGDRKMRLEVSEPLRPKFPDARAQSILDNQRSAFRAGDYAGGIRSIILDVRSVALGAETPTGETAPPSSSYIPPAPSSRSSSGGNAGTIILVVVGIGVLLGIGALVAAAKRSRSLSLSSDGATNLTPFWIDMLLGTLQVIGFLFVIIAIFASATSSSSSSSSSLFGGGGSSGGSSGGGGGWSGGGASSSW